MVMGDLSLTVLEKSAGEESSPNASDLCVASGVGNRHWSDEALEKPLRTGARNQDARFRYGIKSGET